MKLLQREKTPAAAAGMVFLLVVLFLAAGFFFPDPYLASGRAHGVHAALILGLKMCAVLSVLLCAALVLAIWRGIVSAAALVLIPLGFLLAGLLAYPLIGEFVAGRSGRKDIREFHTYLQLRPQVFTPRSESAKKVVALGGSTTRWPNSQGAQWTALVEEKLSARCGAGRYEVYNQGQDWYTTLHSLINYSTNIRRHRPEVVIIMHGINDMMHNADFGYLSLGTFRDDYGHYLGPIAQLVQQKTPGQLIAGYLRRYWYYNGAREHVVQRDFQGVPAFKRNLHTLLDLVALDGAKAILMTEAFSYREGLSDDELVKLDMLRYEGQGPAGYWTLQEGIAGMRAYAEAVREVARERNVPLVDLEARVPKEMVNFLDDVHFSDKGFPLVVDAISESLSALAGCG